MNLNEIVTSKVLFIKEFGIDLVICKFISHVFDFEN